MSDGLAGNRNCTIYSDEEFQDAIAHEQSIPVGGITDPIWLRLHIDPGIKASETHFFTIAAGTAPAPPPMYEALEYAGPLQSELDLPLSLSALQMARDGTYHIGLTFTLFLRESTAICVWDSELGMIFRPGQQEFHIKLLRYRRTDYMVGWEATPI